MVKLLRFLPEAMFDALLIYKELPLVHVVFYRKVSRYSMHVQWLSSLEEMRESLCYNFSFSVQNNLLQHW